MKIFSLTCTPQLEKPLNDHWTNSQLCFQKIKKVKPINQQVIKTHAWRLPLGCLKQPQDSDKMATFAPSLTPIPLNLLSVSAKSQMKKW